MYNIILVLTKFSYLFSNIHETTANKRRELLTGSFAEFLNLPEPKNYRTLLLPNLQIMGSTENLKRLGDWKSASVASTYIENSDYSAVEISNQLSGKRDSAEKNTLAQKDDPVEPSAKKFCLILWISLLN